MNTMLNIEHEYEYKPPRMGLLLVAGFFGLCAVVSGVLASAGEGADVGKSIIARTLDAPPALLWAVCGVSTVAVLVAGVVAIRNLKQRQRIALTPASIIVPKSRWSQEEQAIEYREIKSLSTGETYGQHFLYVFHTGGKYTIVASMLPSKTAFDEVHELIAKKSQQAQEGS